METARIPARSLAIAKEWGLVLISQGIESVLLPSEAGNGWILEVKAAHSTRAFQALRLYHLENRKADWKETALGVHTHFDAGSLAWAAVCVLIYRWGSLNSEWLGVGVMDSSKVFSGQWWRMATALFLHADLVHLAQNMAVGIVLMGLAFGMMGRCAGLLGAVLAGLAGNGLSLLCNPKPFIGLGASGLVMGCLGLIATASMGGIRGQPHGWRMMGIRNALAASLFLFILFALNPGTDVFAHLGGFLAGLVLGAFYGFLPVKLRQSAGFKAACLMIGLGIIAGAWWLAWGHGAAS